MVRPLSNPACRVDSESLSDSQVSLKAGHATQDKEVDMNHSGISAFVIVLTVSIVAVTAEDQSPPPPELPTKLPATDMPPTVIEFTPGRARVFPNDVQYFAPPPAARVKSRLGVKAAATPAPAPASPAPATPAPASAPATAVFTGTSRVMVSPLPLQSAPAPLPYVVAFPGYVIPPVALQAAPGHPQQNFTGTFILGASLDQLQAAPVPAPKMTLSEQLSAPVTISFDGMTVAEALQHLAKQTTLPLSRNARVLIDANLASKEKDESGENQPVPASWRKAVSTLQYHQTPVREILNDLASPHAFVWMRRGSLIDISSLETQSNLIASFQTSEMRLYDVSDLLNGHYTAAIQPVSPVPAFDPVTVYVAGQQTVAAADETLSSIRDALRSCIQTGLTWQIEMQMEDEFDESNEKAQRTADLYRKRLHGEISILAVANTRKLVINCHPYGHHAVEEFLDQLRSSVKSDQERKVAGQVHGYQPSYSPPYRQPVADPAGNRAGTQIPHFGPYTPPAPTPMPDGSYTPVYPKNGPRNVPPSNSRNSY